jgi:DNA-binding XRE family transcriptional regulator
MNIQMKRLYEAAKALRNVEGQSELARIMNASPQTVNNWEARGISNEGLLTAQEVIGCDAIWLRDGTGSMARGGVAAQQSFGEIVRLITLYEQSTSDGRSFILDSADAAEKAVSSGGRSAGNKAQ